MVHTVDEGEMSAALEAEISRRELVKWLENGRKEQLDHIKLFEAQIEERQRWVARAREEVKRLDLCISDIQRKTDPNAVPGTTT